MRTNGILFFFVIATTSLIMVILNWITMTANLLIVTSLLFVLSLLSGILILKCDQKQHKKIMYACCVLFSIMAGYFIYSGGTEGFSVIWLCIFPTIGYLVLQRHIARIFNITVSLMVLLSFLTPLYHYLDYQYTQAFRFRFPVVMIFGGICAWLTEVVRYQTQHRLSLITLSLKESANRDPLTGVGNRNAFREEIEIARRSYPLSYALVDVDYFKQVNDTYGHDAGDIVLKELAKILAENIRPLDRVYRWGGEEFLLVLPNVEGCDLLHTLQRLRQMVEQYDFVVSDDVTLKTTISIGGVSDCRSRSIEQCIKLADRCMYDAKKQGRNRVITKTLGCLDAHEARREAPME